MFAVGSSGTILHYDGLTWTKMASPTTVNLNGVWAASSSDVFAVGLDGTIIHYDGTAWSPMDSPTTNNLFDVWGVSRGNVYAVGDGTFLRYKGHSCIKVVLFTDCPNLLKSFFTVSGGRNMHHPKCLQLV